MSINNKIKNANTGVVMNKKILVDPDPRVLIDIFYPERLQQLRGTFELLEVDVKNRKTFYDEFLPEADFIIGQPALTARQLRSAGKLRAIFNVESNFMDNMDYEICFQQGIHVLSVSPVFAQPVAELGLGLALSLLREIPAAHQAFVEGREVYGLDSNRQARLLADCTVGYIGFGDLGRALHALVRAFGSRCLAYDPWLPPAMLEQNGVEAVSLEEVLQQSDVVFVLATVTTDNQRFLGAKQLAMLPDGASLILLSRAAVMDFSALQAELETGRLRAASDVFDEEPLPLYHPLRKTPHLLFSAHRAGAVDRAFRQMGELVFDDLMLLSQGLPPLRCKRAERETVGRMRSKPVSKS